MTVESAKAKLDAQEGDPATGYISKADHQDSYDELVDDTALTGATTAEALDVTGALTAGTVNGRDPDDLVAGPASATDNALVRFDGTGGKTVQNSGITVDDSGQVTSDLTISKANAAVRMNASSGAADFYLDTTSGNAASLRFRTGTSLRWIVSKDSSAESSTATGSDLYVSGYNNSGSLIGSYLQVQRSTGRFTIYNTGAGAGLRLGSGGPEIMSGTGSPEGVVTAPVGSIWFQTDSTVGVSHWRKASGTGNTGWVVMAGDTGWRDVSADILNGWTGTVKLRRVNERVMVQALAMNADAATNVAYLSLPTGFVADTSDGYVGSAYNTSTNATLYHIIGSTGALRLPYTSLSAGQTARGNMTWTTAQSWPSSLPGSAA